MTHAGYLNVWMLLFGITGGLCVASAVACKVCGPWSYVPEVLLRSTLLFGYLMVLWGLVGLFIYGW